MTCAQVPFIGEPCWLQTSPKAMLVQPSSRQGPRLWHRMSATNLLAHLNCTTAGNMVTRM